MNSHTPTMPRQMGPLVRATVHDGAKLSVMQADHSDLARIEFDKLHLANGEILRPADLVVLFLSCHGAPTPSKLQGPRGVFVEHGFECTWREHLQGRRRTLATTALFVPFVFLPQFALANGSSPVAASALLSILGGVSLVSRLGISIIGNRIASLSLFKGAVLVMAASYILWLLMPGYWWLVAFAICLGLAYGARIALVPSVLIEFSGPQNLGTLLGVFFTATGLAAVIGPLLAGHIVDCSGSYQWGIAFALAMATLGFIAVAPLKSAAVIHNGEQQK